MPTLLDDHATEESTFAITVAFTDDDGSAVSPNAATWTLTDSSGTVINSREDVSISSPTSSETIVLSGDDLQILSGETGDVLRILTVEGDYDSSLGSSLPLKGSCKFVLDNLVAVT